MALIAYLDSIKSRDPAPRSRWEVLLYPGVLGARPAPRRPCAVQGAAVLPRAAGQPYLALPDRHRHPPRRQHRPQFLHRSRLCGHRRDRRNRRQCHHLSVRDAGRHRSGQWHRRQTPPDARRTASSSVRARRSSARSSSARAPASAPMPSSPAMCRKARRWSASRPSRCWSMPRIMRSRSCPMARHVRRSSIPKPRSSNCCAARSKRCAPGSTR